MQLRPVGRTALLAEVEDATQAVALAGWARAARVDAVEIVPGAASVLFDGTQDAAALAERLRDWRPGGPAPSGDVVEVPVEYDGPDLDDVAAAWGTDRAGVAERHAAVEYVAAFCGFAPGFSYLAGLPAPLAVPRLPSPRARVPAGAVGLAGSWCGIYPTASPGGWRLIGRTDAPLWDVDRDPPALLPPGTRVRFVPR